MSNTALINYIAIDTTDKKTIIARGSSIKGVRKEAKQKGKDCIISPDLDDNLTYFF